MQVKTRPELVLGPGPTPRLLKCATQSTHSFHEFQCDSTCIDMDDPYQLKKYLLPTPTHRCFGVHQLLTCLQAPADTAVPRRSKRTKSPALSITRGRPWQFSDAALYLGNSTLAWQGRPGRCCWPFPVLTGLLPYRVAFHAARSHSDHTCISNSAVEDLNIRP